MKFQMRHTSVQVLMPQLAILTKRKVQKESSFNAEKEYVRHGWKNGRNFFALLGRIIRVSLFRIGARAITFDGQYLEHQSSPEYHLYSIL